MISVDNQTVDRILAAYERGIDAGQDFAQVAMPYQRGTPEEYAFLVGMGYGMENHGEHIVLDDALSDVGLLVKERNSGG